MKKLKIDYKKIRFIICNIILILFIFKNAFSNQISIVIDGNDFTDTDVIISLLKDIPTDINNDYSNEIINTLNESDLFSDVRVRLKNNEYIILVKEYPNINKIYFKNNDRLDDEELELIANEVNLTNLNYKSINSFINETKKIYESFGFNNVNIDYSQKINNDNNTVDLYFNFNEGKITKINRIIFNGNNKILAEELKQIISSKTKSLVNIFANNNFKPVLVESDKIKIINHYRNNGFLDVNVNYNIEYLKSNRVNIYFSVDEGKIYSLSSIKIIDNEKIINNEISNIINLKIDNFLFE